MPNPLHLSLFSGIGGLDLAAEMAGFESVGQCENAKYPTKVLEKHWPAVPRWEDIRTLTKENFYERTGLHTVDLISGGFPCQPFSVAGKQKGKGDERYLWPEMLRVVRELAPRWVVGENVPGILRLAAADVIESLEREGYHAVIFDFEAAAVGAPHRRERIAFVAHRGSKGLQGWDSKIMQNFPVYTNSPGEPNLSAQVKLFPTPTTGAGMCGGTGNFKQLKMIMESGIICEEERRSMSAGNGGNLNPNWVEWLMGYPIGWTEV